MNRRFNDVFRGGNGEEASWGHHTWTPPVDTYEAEDALVLIADWPGVSKDDVGIKIYQHTLALKGQRTRNAEVKEDRDHRVERAYGPFQRSLMLPRQVDQEQVQATDYDGVFELRLPVVGATVDRAQRLSARRWTFVCLLHP
jgi:HSP20 family protein